jgi:hypothetical protein
MVDAKVNGAPHQEQAEYVVRFVPVPGVDHVEDVLKDALTEKHIDAVVKRHLLERTMRTSRRRLVGVYLAVSGIASLAILPWAWSTVSRAAVAKQAISAHFLTVPFRLSPEAGVIMIVALMAVVGSVVATMQAFTNRAGHETLERGFLWWYLLRPIVAALLGVAFYLVVIAGLLSASGNSVPALVGAAAIGALAGLFTDQVLTKLRRALGQFEYTDAASGKPADSEK